MLLGKKWEACGKRGKRYSNRRPVDRSRMECLLGRQPSWVDCSSNRNTNSLEIANLGMKKE